MKKYLHVSCIMTSCCLLCGCSDEELPPLPEAKPVVDNRVKLADCVRNVQIEVKNGEKPPHDSSVSIHVKEAVMISATASVDDRIATAEISGQIRCISHRGGKIIILQAARWVGKRGESGVYSGVVKLTIPPGLTAATSLVLNVDGRNFGELPVNLIQ